MKFSVQSILWMQWIEIRDVFFPKGWTSPFSSARIARDKNSRSVTLFWRVMLEDPEVLSIYQSLHVILFHYNHYLHLIKSFSISLKPLLKPYSITSSRKQTSQTNLPNWKPLRLLYVFRSDLSNGEGWVEAFPNVIAGRKQSRFIRWSAAEYENKEI